MDEGMKTVLVQRLQARMTELGLNQLQLAEQAGVNQGLLSMILRGKKSPGADTLARLATATRVSMDYLIGRADASAVEDILQQKEIFAFIEDFLSLPISDQQRVREFVIALQIAKRA